MCLSWLYKQSESIYKIFNKNQNAMEINIKIYKKDN
jgi:hypothetical protein